MRITLRQLELFAAIAKYNNLTQAANSLYISQAAASMALAQLEKQLQSPLFERIGKRIVLNNAGKVLLPKVLTVLAQASEIERVGKKKVEILTGELKIGASTTIGNYLLPAMLTQFIKRHKAVKLQLLINNTEYIINQLLQFNIDMAYIEGYCHHPELMIEKHQEDELVIFAAPQHPLAHKRPLTLTELVKAEWILREQGSGTREVFEKTIYNKINSLNVLLELGSNEAVKQAVATGLGISCLSKASLITELKLKKLVILPSKISIKRNFYCLIHKKKYQSPELKAFLQFTSKSNNI